MHTRQIKSTNEAFQKSPQSFNSH